MFSIIYKVIMTMGSLMVKVSGSILDAGKDPLTVCSERTHKIYGSKSLEIGH